jgi:outer membrane protein TolC
MNRLHRAWWSVLWLCLPALAESAPAALALGDALRLAVAADPWLVGSQYREEALLSEATAAGSLPDPKLNIAAGNLPLDTFDVNQEAMTQFTVGVSQAFPRGDSRALSRQQRTQLAEQEPLLREERSAQVQRTVTQLWFTAYLAQETIGLVEQSRGLFDQLLEAAGTRYSAALGSTRQQDLVRAQLELTRLEDRLTGLQQRRDAAQRQLAEWIGAEATLPLAPPPRDSSSISAAVLRASSQQYRDWIVRHPAVRAVDRHIDAVTTEVELARQGYRPAWGVSAQYGYRDDDPMGRDRADLFSVGVTLDLPLFTDDRQDQQVSATLARVEALRTERQLLARRLLAELETALARLQRVDERADLYATRLLPQMADQAEAALAAYNNDDGDFAEAVRARIAQLDARMASLAIAVERQQLMASIHYLTVAAGYGHAQAPAQQMGETQ